MHWSCLLFERERERKQIYSALICVHHRVDVILKHPLRDPTCAPERHIINNKMRTARVTSKQILTTHTQTNQFALIITIMMIMSTFYYCARQGNEIGTQRMRYARHTAIIIVASWYAPKTPGAINRSVWWKIHYIYHTYWAHRDTNSIYYKALKQSKKHRRRWRRCRCRRRHTSQAYDNNHCVTWTNSQHTDTHTQTHSHIR